MMTTQSHRLVASCSLLVTVFVACGGESPDYAQQTSAIVGGVPDRSRSEIGIGRILYADRFLCTGTLIGSNGQPYVLTAAHCLEDPDTGRPWNPAGKLTVEFLGKAFRARAVYPHPEEDAQNYRNDIGIIELERMPTHVRSALVALTPPEPGMEVTVVGYGATDFAPAGRARHAAPSLITKVRRPWGYDLISPAAAGGRAGAFCGGDSGGPTFTTHWGPETLIGVHSALRTTGLDVASDGSSPSASDVRLCRERESFDVALAFQLAASWLWDVTSGNINTYDGLPPDEPHRSMTDDGVGSSVRPVAQVPGVRPSECSYTGGRPPAAVLALLLLAIAARLRRR
jgi:MYXO-CTERM domain-containing protein